MTVARRTKRSCFSRSNPFIFVVLLIFQVPSFSTILPTELQTRNLGIVRHVRITKPDVESDIPSGDDDNCSTVRRRKNRRIHTSQSSPSNLFKRLLSAHAPRKNFVSTSVRRLAIAPPHVTWATTREETPHRFACAVSYPGRRVLFSQQALSPTGCWRRIFYL